MRNVVCVATLCLGLGGCGLPVGVSIATTVMDVMSFASSGKTVSDHALSAVADEDCAMLRVVTEGSPCRPVGANGEGRTSVALMTADEPRGRDGEEEVVRVVRPGPPPRPVTVTASAGGAAPARTPAVVPAGSVLIGTFTSEDNARRAAEAQGHTNVRVEKVRIHDRDYFHALVDAPVVRPAAPVRVIADGGRP